MFELPDDCWWSGLGQLSNGMKLRATSEEGQAGDQSWLRVDCGQVGVHLC